MATLSVRSIPKELYKALKDLARLENRSLNQQVIWLLREGLKAGHINNDAVWNRISQRRLRLSQTGQEFSDTVALLRKDRER